MALSTLNKIFIGVALSTVISACGAPNKTRYIYNGVESTPSTTDDTTHTSKTQEFKEPKTYIQNDLPIANQYHYRSSNIGNRSFSLVPGYRDCYNRYSLGYNNCSNIIPRTQHNHTHGLGHGILNYGLYGHPLHFHGGRSNIHSDTLYLNEIERSHNHNRGQSPILFIDFHSK